MDKKILVLGNQTNYDFKQNPIATKDIVSGYEIITPENKQFKDIVIKDDNDLINLTQVVKDNFMQHYVPSRLFKNIYYPLLDFEKQYENDLKFVCMCLFSKLGGKVEIMEIEEESSIEESSDFNADAEINTPSTDIESSFNKKESKENKNRVKSRISIKGINLKLSSQDLKDYIEEKNININCLPAELKMMIEHYIAHGEILANKELNSIEYFEEISSYIKNNNNLASGLQISIKKMPKFLSANLNVTTQSNITKSYNKKLHYKVVF